MPFIEHADIAVYYETHGSGPPLLLVAGLASDSQSWLPVIPQLAGRFTVIVCDNRGSGRSRPLDRFVDISGMADDCRLLLDHLGIAAVHLVGHSMGGFIAQELTLTHPSRILSLTLAATACRASRRNNVLFADWAVTRDAVDRQPWFRSLFSWLVTERFFEDPSQVTAAVTGAVDYPYPPTSTSFANQVRAIAGFDRSRDLAQIAVPTLILTGKEDILFPPETAATLLRLLPQARRVEIEGAAHSIHLEQPAAFCRAVMTFVAANALPMAAHGR